MAIYWDRLSRQLFTVLSLNAVLVVLVPFGVWGGMWNSIVSAPDHCIFCLLFTVNPSSELSPAFEKWSSHGTSKAFSECRRHETGRAGRAQVGGGGSPSRKGVWVISPEKILSSERL